MCYSLINLLNSTTTKLEQIAYNLNILIELCEAAAYVTFLKFSVERLIRTLSAKPILQTMMTFPLFMAMSLVSQRQAVQTLHTCGLATSFYCTAVQLFLFAFALSHTISICPCRFHSPQFFFFFL